MSPPPPPVSVVVASPPPPPPPSPKKSPPPPPSPLPPAPSTCFSWQDITPEAPRPWWYLLQQYNTPGFASFDSAILLPPTPEFAPNSGVGVRFRLNDPSPCTAPEDSYVDICLLPFAAANAPPPPAAVDPAGYVLATLTLAGYTTATFGPRELAAVKAAVAEASGGAAAVSVLGVTNGSATTLASARRRPPPPAAGGRHHRRTLLGGNTTAPPPLLPPPAAPGIVALTINVTSLNTTRVAELLQVRKIGCFSRGSSSLVRLHSSPPPLCYIRIAAF